MKPPDATFPRALTDRERHVARWIIERSTGPKSELMRQLEKATVIGRCSCGCASVDFAIASEYPPPSNTLEIIGDYQFGDEKSGLSGVFAFARCGILAGIEIYPLSDEKVHAELPSPDVLRPIVSGES